MGAVKAKESLGFSPDCFPHGIIISLSTFILFWVLKSETAVMAKAGIK